MHFDLYDPVAAAGLTPAALYVKAEPPLAVSLGLGVGRRRKQVPDQIEHARIRCRVGPGRPADGRLVDGDDLIQLAHAVDAAVSSGNGPGPVQLLCQGLIQYLIDQRALSRAGHACYTGHHSQGDIHIHIFQVILPGAPHLQPACGLPPL